MTFGSIRHLQRAVCASLVLSSALFISTAHAKDDVVPFTPVDTSTPLMTSQATGDAPNSPPVYRVSADKTPSGFAVPRFVSLKFGKVNARTGPSRDHAIAYQYQRRGLPLMVVAETEMWRKVRDFQGDEAWVRKPALSGDRFAVTMQDATLSSKPSATSRNIARIESGVLMTLEDCTDEIYCRVQTRNGIKGYMAKQFLWGAQDIN